MLLQKMSFRLDSVTFPNPSPCLNRPAPSITPRHAPPPASLGFGAFPGAKFHRKVSIQAIPTVLGAVTLRQRYVPKRSVASFAAAQEESEKEDSEVEARETEEEWQETLDSFKQHALKMQSISKEAYEQYSEKAVIILKETAENLKIRAEKARQDLALVAKEIAEESKEYFSAAAENSPNEIREIFASSSDEFKDVSKLRDFHVGIPYGALLFVGGFLSFMLTGSISAVRFGIVNGCLLFYLSKSSLRSWKKGEFSLLNLTAQTLIALSLFLTSLHSLLMRPFPNLAPTLVSGGVFAFYVYRIIKEREARAENQSSG